MDQNMIVLEGIGRTYAEKGKVTEALKEFGLTVPKGSFVTLMGASGCGKSTVSKIAAGIEKHDVGRLMIDGTEIGAKGIPLEIRKRIGYVFQLHNLADWRTVEGNLYFPLEMYDQKKDDTWRQRADKYLEFVGLTRYRDVYPRELSGGMKQRVGIARALMMEPEILIFDQPFGALDAITRGMLAAKLYKLVRETGKTCLMVTSDIDEAAQYSDRVCIMEGKPGHVKTMIENKIPVEHRLNDDIKLTDEFMAIKMQLTQAIYNN